MYESYFKEILKSNAILLKYKDLLKTLSNERVMCVGYDVNDNFYIIECCDDYYSHDLTKEECLELSELFKEIAEELDER